VNVTVTPLTGFEYWSVTVAASGANVLLTGTLCGVPLLAVMVAAAPALLVRLKLAGDAAPEVVAVTV
jgi:hypothetical protein